MNITANVMCKIAKNFFGKFILEIGFWSAPVDSSYLYMILDYFRF